MTKLQIEFENTGYTSWINSDIYPDGKIYTQEYTRWLEKELLASRESKSAVPNDLDIHKEAMALYDRIDTMSFKAGAKWAINFKRGIDG